MPLALYTVQCSGNLQNEQRIFCMVINFKNFEIFDVSQVLNSHLFNVKICAMRAVVTARRYA